MHVFWMVGGRQSTWRKPTQSQGQHANSTQGGMCPNQGLNPEPLLLLHSSDLRILTTQLIILNY